MTQPTYQNQGDRAASTGLTVLRLGLLLAATLLLHLGHRHWRAGQFPTLSAMLPLFAAYWTAFALMVLSLTDAEKITSTAAQMQRWWQETHVARRGRAIWHNASPRWQRGARAAWRYGPYILAAIMGTQILVHEVGNRGMGTDSLLFSNYGLDLWLAGKNPYAESMEPAVQHYPFDSAYATFRLDGTQVAELSYPAGSLWAFLPQKLFHIGNLNLTALAALFGLVLYLMRRRAPLAAWAPLLLLACDNTVLRYSAGGVFDVLWMLPMVLAITAWRRGRLALSGMWVGLACTVKQTPWLIVPFLAIWIVLASHGARHCIKRLLWFGGALALSFVVVNLPLAYSAPQAWLHGALLPAGSGAELVQQGVGAALASVEGVAPLPRVFFVLLLLFAAAVAAASYTLYFARLKHTAWVMPCLLLWFHHRSLQNYFAVFPFIACAIILLNHQYPPLSACDRPWPMLQHYLQPLLAVRRSILLTFAVSGVMIFVPLAYYFNHTHTLALDLQIDDIQDPAHVDAIGQMTLHLHNRGAQPLNPLLIIKHDKHVTPTIWPIVAGPTQLPPDGEANITIQAPCARAQIPMQTAFRVNVVQRGTAQQKMWTVRKKQPAHVRNDHFALWEPHTKIGLRFPFGWQPSPARPWLEAAASVQQIPEGLLLQLRPPSRPDGGPAQLWASLNQDVASFDALALDFTPLNRPEPMTPHAWPKKATGVQVMSGDQKIWIIPAETATTVMDSVHSRGKDAIIVYIKAQQGQRSQTTVALRDVLSTNALARWRRTRSQVALFAWWHNGPSPTVPTDGLATIFHSVRDAPTDPRQTAATATPACQPWRSTDWLITSQALFDP